MRVLAKMSVSIKVALLISIGFGSWWFYDFKRNAKFAYDETQRKMVSDVLAISKFISQNFGFEEKNLESISIELENRVLTGDIHFYYIVLAEKVKAMKQLNPHAESNVLAYALTKRSDDLLNEIMTYKDVRYVIKKNRDFMAIFGFHTNKEKTIDYFTDENTASLLRDIFIVFITAFIFMELFVKLVLVRLAKSLLINTKQSKLFRLISSKEVDLLEKGIDGFLADHEKLLERVRIHEMQIPAAIRNEMLLDRKEYEQIHCAIVSTDINRSSNIQANFPVEVYAPVFKEVMNAIIEVVGLYGGNSYKFVGDEIIYYFSNSDKYDSCTMAISAVRDIQVKINEIRNNHAKSVGFDIITKSAISYGKVTFTHINHIFEIMGASISEAVRIAALIEDKSKNMLYLSEDVRYRSSDLVNTKEVGTFKLKGLDFNCNVHEYISHRPVSDVLNGLTSYTVSLLTYYRSSDDFLVCLEFLKNNLEQMDKDIFLSVLAVWKNFPSTNKGAVVRDKFTDLVKYINTNTSTPGADSKYKYYLSSIVAVTFNVVDKNTYHDELIELLTKFTTHEYSKRTVANAIEVLGLYNTDQDYKIINKLLVDENNRVRSNTIIKEGLKNFDSRIFKYLKKMLRKKEKLFIASGVYAAKEIFLFHQKNKRSYNVNVYFDKTISELKRHVGDENEMVKRQLIAAASVIEDPGFREAVNSKYQAV